MPRFILIPAVAVTLAFAGCGGGSSGPTEEDAAELLESHTAAANVQCVKSGSSSDREFDCTGIGTEGGQYLSGSKTVRIKATVGESGETVFVNDCEPTGEVHGVGKLCNGIG